MLLVFVLVGVGSTVHYGAFKWHALILMLVALGVCFRLHLRQRLTSASAEAVLLGLLPVFLAFIACMAVGHNQTLVYYRLPGVVRPYQRYDGYGMAIRILATVGFVLALTYIGLQWRRHSRKVAARFAVLVLIAVSCRVLILKSSPTPVIDVFVSQTTGAKGLLLQLTPESRREAWAESLTTYDGKIDRDELWTLSRWHNVYAMVFPSPYWNPEQAGPRFDGEGRLFKQAWFDHYGYPPATVYANALSWWAFRDVRGLWVLCDLIGALCIWTVVRRTRPGPDGRRFGELVTLVFLFMPRSLFIIEQSWTEPLAVASLGVFAVLLLRPASALARGVAMGVLFSGKQYVVLAAPLIWKLRRCKPAAWLAAGLVGIALILPFALWDWSALFHDVLGFFLKSPPRPDALSIYGAFSRYGHEIPWWVVAPLWLAGVAFFTWRMQRTLAGMLFSTASVWLFFFMLGKQAFMNYWYLILYALLLAVAATRRTAPNASPGT